MGDGETSEKEDTSPGASGDKSKFYKAPALCFCRLLSTQDSVVLRLVWVDFESIRSVSTCRCLLIVDIGGKTFKSRPSLSRKV